MPIRKDSCLKDVSDLERSSVIFVLTLDYVQKLINDSGLRFETNIRILSESG